MDRIPYESIRYAHKVSLDKPYQDYIAAQQAVVHAMGLPISEAEAPTFKEIPLPIDLHSPVLKKQVYPCITKVYNCLEYAEATFTSLSVKDDRVNARVTINSAAGKESLEWVYSKYNDEAYLWRRPLKELLVYASKEEAEQVLEQTSLVTSLLYRTDTLLYHAKKLKADLLDHKSFIQKINSLIQQIPTE